MRAAKASYGRPGHMAVEFSYVHTLNLASKGNLYIAETIGGHGGRAIRTPEVRPDRARYLVVYARSSPGK
jgi:hypothetical protein